jgi:hypothetical protein
MMVPSDPDPLSLLATVANYLLSSSSSSSSSSIAQFYHNPVAFQPSCQEPIFSKKRKSSVLYASTIPSILPLPAALEKLHLSKSPGSFSSIFTDPNISHAVALSNSSKPLFSQSNSSTNIFSSGTCYSKMSSFDSKISSLDSKTPCLETFHSGTCCFKPNAILIVKPFPLRFKSGVCLFVYLLTFLFLFFFVFTLIKCFYFFVK